MWPEKKVSFLVGRELKSGSKSAFLWRNQLSLINHTPPERRLNTWSYSCKTISSSTWAKVRAPSALTCASIHLFLWSCSQSVEGDMLTQMYSASYCSYWSQWQKPPIDILKTGTCIFKEILLFGKFDGAEGWGWRRVTSHIWARERWRDIK